MNYKKCEFWLSNLKQLHCKFEREQRGTAEEDRRHLQAVRQSEDTTGTEASHGQTPVWLNTGWSWLSWDLEPSSECVLVSVLRMGRRGVDEEEEAGWSWHWLSLWRMEEQTERRQKDILVMTFTDINQAQRDTITCVCVHLSDLCEDQFTVVEVLEQERTVTPSETETKKTCRHSCHVVFKSSHSHGHDSNISDKLLQI